MKKTNGLTGRLLLEKDGASFLGGRRVALLEAIDVHGSISAAARAVGMSYKGAWDAVDALNNQSEHPLVVRSVGGKEGGGTRLTEHGRRIVQLFRAGEAQYQQVLDNLLQGVDRLDAFQQVVQRFSMRTSARNQFVGKITHLARGPVNTVVHLKLDRKNTLQAVVTSESAVALGLQVGLEVTALIKAPAVLLTTDPSAGFSAENRLCGRIARIHQGEVDAEVRLALDEGKTVVATVTHDTVARLGLAEGVPACALIPASSVLLALMG
ncbi:MAG: TOBE domain-containing protein [Betaproteobacteria bacterium]|nr:TOBE domain-containing protein [Betaproteobacteria bacterium]MDE2623018.1 TOBE domain-containing protein [Betaproteobacteria bacterium]